MAKSRLIPLLWHTAADSAIIAPLRLKQLDNARIHTHKCDQNKLMNARRNGTVMPRYFLQICIVVAMLFLPQHSAQAISWQPLNGTARHNAAYDKHSVRLTPLGRLEIRIRFIPRGEVERKSAAVEYKEKNYRSHLEYYEIDCSDQTAVLGSIDILGASGARLKRLQGGGQPDTIPPGSVLDKAAEQICPVPDEEIEEDDDPVEPAPSNESDKGVEKNLDSDTLQKIENLRKETASKGATVETWKQLGNIYFDTDQPEQAISAYEHALALKPDDVDTLNDQGAMFRQIGDFKRAVENFEKAFVLDPGNLESLYNGGYVYAFDLDNIPKALVIWHRYLEQESNSEAAQQIRSFVERYESKAATGTIQKSDK